MIKKTDFSDSEKLEKYSSAFTLSDMEIFIFPELFYSLLIANIMSPVIWEWLNDPWFANIDKKSFNYKVNRIKQYIMQNFVFNLDLETWGLTKKQKEIDRFDNFIDTDILKQSNALFGYEGDKYYFSMDIRKHFGLDKYDSEIIPYWKTETVEAMNAFQYKEEYTTGAGECVSLSALYAAAMFIVGKIPLEQLFLIATPLHSQNFITEKNGIITNNRRILTKTMWFNGTSLSSKARRALENEKITIVSHLSGYIHTVYKDATIDKKEYDYFMKSITSFLKADFSPFHLCNFLRTDSKFRKCFQYRYIRNGRDHFLELEKIFEYEHSSQNSFSGDSRHVLLNEIDAEEFSLSVIDNRAILNNFEEFLTQHQDLSHDEIEKHFLENFLTEKCTEMEEMFNGFRDFLEVKPKFPEYEKNYISEVALNIKPEHSRSDIITHIKEISSESEVALLSLYVFRDMNNIDWKPFIKAAIDRNPVSLNDLKSYNEDKVYNILDNMENNSIYDSGRLALPDEVWNYKKGDGLEKAFLLAGFIYNRYPEVTIDIIVNNNNIKLSVSGKEYFFYSTKNFNKQIQICRDYIVIN